MGTPTLMSTIEVSPEAAVVVDDTSPLITFAGAWGHDQGISGVASASNDKVFGPPFNDTATFAEDDLSLSFTFTGTNFMLFGGINFLSSGIFAHCFMDGVLSQDSTRFTTIEGVNHSLFCSNTTSMLDGTHVLTFNLTGMGSHTPAPGANGVANRVWIDEIVYQPLPTVDTDTVPAIMVFAKDSQITYSTGWTFDNTNDAQITSENGASCTFAFHGTSIDYYGTLVGNPIPYTSSSIATYSIDGQAPIPFSVVNFDLGSTPNNVPLFSSGALSAGRHTVTVVNEGNSSFIPLALQYLIVVPSAASAIVDATTTDTGTITTLITATGTLGISPPTASVSELRKSKRTAKSVRKIAEAVGITIIILFVILFICLFFRRRRRRKAARTALQNITANPPIEIPIPLSLPNNRQRINLPRKTTRFLENHSASTPPRLQPREPARDMIRRSRSKLGLTLSNQDAVASLRSNSRRSSLERNPAPEVPSAVVIDHNDSAIRLPQKVHRVVDFPPAYAP